MSNYELKSMDWPPVNKPKTIIDLHKDYPKDTDEFAGLFCLHNYFTKGRFLKNSNQFYLFVSEFMAQTRIYIVDTT